MVFIIKYKNYKAGLIFNERYKSELGNTLSIKNPELDQLSGRFSPNRGKFGIAACREIEDMSTFLARCNDTVKDNRGVIIPLVDSDFVYMLENFENNNIIWEEVLQERFHEVCIN